MDTTKEAVDARLVMSRNSHDLGPVAQEPTVDEARKKGAAANKKGSEAPVAKAIVLLGNPGAGKSFLLNSLVGSVVFTSGFSPGCGLTKHSQSHTHAGRVFIDTPGLACVRLREQAAAAISEVLSRGMEYTLIFVITLEASYIRPQDSATIELVLEALRDACSMVKYGVIVNKATQKDIQAVESGDLKNSLRFPGTEAAITWLDEQASFEDKPNVKMKLPSRITDFIFALPGVLVKAEHVAPVQWNKFERLKAEHEQMIDMLTAENIDLAETRNRLMRALGADLGRKEGDSAAVSSPPHYYTQDSTDTDSVRRNKILELAHRGIELGRILEFYTGLGQKMPSFDPQKSTTFDVVKDAIIPLTSARMCSFSELVRERPLEAGRMVSHNWGNLFSHFVAGIVADAMDLPKYCDVVERLTPESLPALQDDLHQMGVLRLVYWACPFCVNQHHSICHKLLPEPCCKAPKYVTGEPRCEMDKFDDMMEYMLKQNSSQGVQRHVVNIDRGGVIFTRAWVIAELVVTAELSVDSTTDMEQKFRVYDEESLQAIHDSTKGTGIDIRDCEASNPDDKTMILSRAAKSIRSRDSTFEKFNEDLNQRVFDIIGRTCSEIRAMEKLHVLCIGNPGVGTTTLINSMVGSAVFQGDQAWTAWNPYREHDHNGTLFIEAQGLATRRSRKYVAEGLTKALRKDGLYKIFFVITLESGRVRPQDKEIMALVLNAAPIQKNYTVVINKVSKDALGALHDKEIFNEIIGDLFSELEATECIRLVEKVKHPCAEVIPLPPNFTDDAPCLPIKSGRVRDVDGRTEAQVVAELSAHEKKLKESVAVLKMEVNSLQQGILPSERAEAELRTAVREWKIAGCNTRDEMHSIHDGAVHHHLPDDLVKVVELAKQYCSPELLAEIRQEIEATKKDQYYEGASWPAITDVNSHFYDCFTCFDAAGSALLSDGRRCLVSELYRGCEVWTPYGPAAVLCVTRTRCPGGVWAICRVGPQEARVTRNHPVRIDGRWCLPQELGTTELMPCTYIYNFLLESGHIIDIDGVECATLGYGDFHGDLVPDPFYGTDAVIRSLQADPGWEKGLVIRESPEEREAAWRSRVDGLLLQVLYVSEVCRGNSSMALKPRLLRALHILVLGSDSNAGAYRRKTSAVCHVGVRHRPPPPGAVASLVKQYMAKTKALLAAGRNAVEVASYCLWWVVAVHPFYDGNGRAARGLAAIILSRDARCEDAGRILTRLHAAFAVGTASRRDFCQALRWADEAADFCTCGANESTACEQKAAQVGVADAVHSVLVNVLT